jgi:transposase
LACVFDLIKRVTNLATSTRAAKRQGLDRKLGAILVTQSRCDLSRALQADIGQARDQLVVFLAYPGAVEPTNNGRERRLRLSVIQRAMINGCRAMEAAEGEADIPAVVDDARLIGASPFGTIFTTFEFKPGHYDSE